MRVAVVGAGPIGRATAAYLAHHGREVAIWSPTGRSLGDLQREDAGVAISYEGVLSGRVVVPLIERAADLATRDVVIIAVPGHAYPHLLPAVADVLRSNQLLIVSGALSLAPLWLRQRMQQRGLTPAVIVGWGTTLGTARRTPSASVRLNTVRARFDMAALPTTAGAAALRTCEALFGPRFNLAEHVLAVTLANVNPIAHAAEMVPNLTRIDREEDWPLFHYLTPSAARLCAALDAERLALARAFGVRVRTIEEHYRLSYHVDGSDIAGIAEAIHAKYQGPLGPKTLNHRYVLEDVPFGLVVLETLARCAGVDVPHISGSTTLLSTVCVSDFRAANPLIRDLAIAGDTPEELLARCRGDRD